MKPIQKLTAFMLTLCLMFSLLPVQTMAEEVAGGQCGENLTWKVDHRNVLTISGTGAMWEYDYTEVPWRAYRTDVHTILVEYGVTSITPWAFLEFEKLTNITLPDSVQTIGMGSFHKCKALETVTLPAALTVIEADLFSACWALRSVILPSNLTRLEQSAFNGCSALVSLTLPESVTALGKWAVSACFNMGSLLFLGDAPDIAEDALCYFRGTAWYPAGNPTWTAEILEKSYEQSFVTWKSYCTGSHSFSGEQDTSCDICDYDRSIRGSGMAGNQVTWTLDNAGKLTFSGNGDMWEDIYPDSSWQVFCQDIKAVVVEDGITSVSPWAFFECSNLKEVSLPDSVKTIGSGAFRRCKSLETVDLPDELTVIEDDLFSACWALKSITLPEGITRLEQSAFNGCEKLTEITIPASVTRLDKWSLAACVGITKIVFTGNAPAIANDAFSWTSTTALYPADDPTWDSSVLHNSYENADITWEPYNSTVVESVPMYRMYDPNSGEHFYSGSELERDFLVSAGWHYEGVGFNFPVEGAPVHRLYDPVHGEHLYTMDKQEMNRLLNAGWQYEGVAFNSAGTDEVPQYRLHNPNAKRGGYHFTGSEEERNLLISFGWIDQGIGWYSCVE